MVGNLSSFSATGCISKLFWLFATYFMHKVYVMNYLWKVRNHKAITKFLQGFVHLYIKQHVEAVMPLYIMENIVEMGALCNILKILLLRGFENDMIRYNMLRRDLADLIWNWFYIPVPRRYGTLWHMTNMIWLSKML